MTAPVETPVASPPVLPTATTNGAHGNGLTNGHDVPSTNGAKPIATDSPNGVKADPFSLSEEYAYTPRKLKVITIGAGFSGLLIAHKLQHRFPEVQDFIDHTIFESRKDVGGTWLANDYPGVQCDVPAHIYVSSYPYTTSLGVFIAVVAIIFRCADSR